MKRLLLFSILIFILLSAACSSTPGILNIDSNLMAEKLAPGQIYGMDFMMENDYFFSFVRTVNLESYSLDGNIIRYQQSWNLTDYTSYFAWVCYPQYAKSSQATIIFIEDVGGTLQQSGDWTVRAIARMDTSKALIEFGGTSGTAQNGW